MIHDHQPPRIDPSKRAGIILLVVLLHLLLLYWMAMLRGEPTFSTPAFPPMEVRLFSPGGGGTPGVERAEPVQSEQAPASSLHVPPETYPWPETVAAPPDSSAQQPDLGMSTDILPPQTAAQTGDVASALPEAGAGGRGGGIGGGVGPGVGSGVGAGRNGRGTGAVLIRGPVGATISQNVSPASLAALPGSFAVLRCEIRLTQRLERCRVLREHPGASGVGQAALARAQEFRFQPPRTGTRQRDRHRITIAIAFPPEVEDGADP